MDSFISVNLTPVYYQGPNLHLYTTFFNHLDHI